MGRVFVYLNGLVYNYEESTTLTSCDRPMCYFTLKMGIILSWNSEISGKYEIVKDVLITCQESPVCT